VARETTKEPNAYYTKFTQGLVYRLEKKKKGGDSQQVRSDLQHYYI